VYLIQYQSGNRYSLGSLWDDWVRPNPLVAEGVVHERGSS